MTLPSTSRRRLLRQLVRQLGAATAAAAVPAAATPAWTGTLAAPVMNATAATVTAVAADRPPLRLAVLDQMPWAGRNDQGRPAGVVVDMARLLATASGTAIDTIALPYARAAAMLAHGKVDLMLAIDTGTLAGLPAPLDMLGGEDIVIVGRHGSGYRSLDDLCGRTVGHLRRATFIPAFANAGCLRRYEVNSYEQGLRMLMLQRLDAMLGVRSTIDYVVGQQRMDAGGFGAPLVLARAGLALYVAPQLRDRALIARLHDASELLRRQQQLPALLALHRRV
ncbi:MAG: transporter substrate-binding domain-containing protein [Duganella sp.]